jgi:transcriptional regulator with XRE-family HTH domain
MLMDTNKLIETLESRRKEIGISMRKLAKEAGTSHGTYPAMLSNKSDVSFNNACAYARVLGLEIEVRVK